MQTKSHVINERKNRIESHKNLSTIMKINSPKGEYSLKQNFFDPTKNSPPNDFLLKLNMRLSVYNSFIKDDNCDNE